MHKLSKLQRRNVDSPASQLQNKISVHIKLQKPCQSSLLPLFLCHCQGCHSWTLLPKAPTFLEKSTNQLIASSICSHVHGIDASTIVISQPSLVGFSEGSPEFSSSYSPNFLPESSAVSPESYLSATQAGLPVHRLPAAAAPTCWGASKGGVRQGPPKNRASAPPQSGCCRRGPKPSFKRWWYWHLDWADLFK